MSLQAFQRALCHLIASPALCLELRSDPERILERYDLSPRERRRLVAVVWQRGMSTNCSLYRNNRIAPVYTLLPYTCYLLGDALMGEAERFWASRESTDLQFKHEVDRFGAFLKRRIAQGALRHPMVGEVLEFELAATALRFLPHRHIAAQLARAASHPTGSPIRPHPLSRVVRFRHDPARLLRCLAERQSPPSDLAQGEFFVHLSADGNELVVRQIDPALGRLAETFEATPERMVEPQQAARLVEAGVAVS